MHQSASNLLSQSSVKQKRLSLGVYCPPKELLNHSARNNYQSTPESSSHSQLTTTNLTTRKANIPPSIYGISPAQVATPSITTDHLMLNRKLTKGYSKFLEEKGFISRRDEERQKVQEDIRRSLANDSQKVISTEIQKLITSTIVNESIKKPRAVLRSTDSNINNGELGKYDEKHKQVCNRILGGSFENNFLFMKVQKENTLLPIPPSYKKFPKKPNTINKACSFSGVNHINDYSMSARTEPRIKKSASGVLPPSLTDLGKDKSDKNRERKLTADDLESKVPSLTVIGPESVKGNDEVETMNDFQFQTVIFSQTQICEGSENDKKLTKSSSSARSRKYLNDTNSGSLRDLSAKLEETNKRLRGNAFEATLYKNIENNKQFKKAGRRYQSFTEENLETQNKMTPKLSSIKGSISKINELCDGAIRSTSILGHKLRQQHVRTGKDFVNLDILVEKLTYENTIQNWEKSVKQVENMESRNFFSNMA